ncbi:MAG: hypothetical protein O7H41_21500 [Planctomycetota bacterium]|nr:hypothetical protein [Planctomycetota bacterium]
MIPAGYVEYLLNCNGQQSRPLLDSELAGIKLDRSIVGRLGCEAEPPRSNFGR